MIQERLELDRVFPFWKELTQKEQRNLLESMVENSYPKGTLLHYGGSECAGVQIIRTGQARVFVTSPNGGEITLFRLIEGDVSILSARCV